MMKYFCVLLYVLESIHTFLRLNLPWLWNLVDTLTLIGVDILRVGAGRVRATGVAECRRPKEPLKLYEYEACMYCRKVRETLSTLDIDHIVYPCPRETFSSHGVCLNSRFRPDVKKEGGLVMFPFLIDPNTNTKMYQSGDIVEYLWKTYGDKATPTFNYRVAYTKYYLDLSLALCILLRPCLDMGLLRAPTRAPAKNLELWGYESSFAVRRVKEVLCTLEMPYLFHVLPIGSTEKRKEFLKDHAEQIGQMRQTAGYVKVPYLRDPNTKKEMFESKDIVAYLKEQYQTRGVPAETWLDFASKT